MNGVPVRNVYKEPFSPTEAALTARTNTVIRQTLPTNANTTERLARERHAAPYAAFDGADWAWSRDLCPHAALSAVLADGGNSLRTLTGRAGRSVLSSFGDLRAFTSKRGRRMHATSPFVLAPQANKPVELSVGREGNP